MKYFFKIGFALSFLLFSKAMAKSTHVETVAKCVVTETSKELLIDIHISNEYVSILGLDIDNFHNEIVDVLKINAFFLERLTLILDDVPKKMMFKNYVIDKSFLRISYTLKKENPHINSFEVRSVDFSFLKNHHNVFDFWLHINNRTRLFKLKNNKTNFKAIY